ncbi:MAG: ABC transporter substrate-binding protein [Lachnospirales bacterium]
MKRKLKLTSSIIALTLILSSCGNSNTAQESNMQNTETTTTAQTTEVAETTEENVYYPVVVDSHEYVNGVYTEISQTFEKIPERVYCNNQTSFETLLALGVADRVVATPRLGNPIANGLEDELSEVEANIDFIDDPWPPREIVLGSDPDFITGRGALFHNETYGHGSVENYNESGIPTYVLEGMLPTATIESVTDDVRNYGKIFNKEDEAEVVAEEFEERLNAINEKLSGITEDYGVILLTNYHDNTFSTFLGKDGITADILDTVHCHTVFEGPGFEVSAEQLIDMNPDYIFYMDYVGSVLTAEEAIAELYANTTIETVSAIANQGIYKVSYNGMNAGGLSTIDQLEELATLLYPDEMGASQ